MKLTEKSLKNKGILLESSRYMNQAVSLSGDQTHKKIFKQNAEIQFPEIEYGIVENSIAIGGTNALIEKDENLILNNAKKSEPIFLTRSIKENKTKITVKIAIEKFEISKAITLLGPETGNYAHWLFESLPKLYLATETFDLNDSVQLIDDWKLSGYQNIIESMKLVLKKNFNPQFVSQYHGIRVGELTYINNTAAQDNNLQNNYPESSNFHQTAILGLKNHLLNLLGKQKSQELIYLHRDSAFGLNGRKLLNQDKIEALLKNEKFQVLKCSELNFQKQVQAMSCAKKVIAPAGASLANILFAPTGCEVIILVPSYPNANFYYWANLANLLGHHVTFISGKARVNSKKPEHSDFFINLTDLKNQIIKE